MGEIASQHNPEFHPASSLYAVPGDAETIMEDLEQLIRRGLRNAPGAPKARACPLAAARRFERLTLREASSATRGGSIPSRWDGGRFDGLRARGVQLPRAVLGRPLTQVLLERIEAVDRRRGARRS